MKKYTEYKDTNVEWIGEIPEHWGLIRTKYIFDISKERITEENPTILSLTQKGIKVRDVSNNEGQVSASYANYAKVRIGDIVLNPMDLISGFVDSAKIEGIISPAYTILRPSILNKYSSHPEYHNYYLQKHYLEGILFHLGEGVSAEHRWTLKNYDLQQLKVLVPSLDEQTQISSYLDNKTSLIDKLINNNKKLIKLLEEKRTALINKVITKGLDPNVKMKDSGIEWIGEIPEHWEVKRLKYLTQLLTERTRKNQNLNKVALENIQSKTTRYVETDSEFQADGISFKKGDLLFGKLRPYLVKIWVAEFAGSAVGDFFVLRNNEDLVSSEYLKYLLISDLYVQLINGSTFGAKMPRVSWEFMTNIKLLLPNLREQAELTSCLESLTREIDDRIKFINRKNKLLKEYRQSLISNVVTGKVKVINL